jgi:hypothetical protein
VADLAGDEAAGRAAHSANMLGLHERASEENVTLNEQLPHCPRPIRYQLGDAELVCFDTPGHTRGHITLYFPAAKALFPGRRSVLEGREGTLLQWHAGMASCAVQAAAGPFSTVLWPQVPANPSSPPLRCRRHALQPGLRAPV